MKYVFLVFSIIFNIYAQGDIDYIHRSVQKNIIAFHLHSDLSLDTKKKNFYCDATSKMSFINNFIFDKPLKLDMNILPSSTYYFPDSSYRIYEIYKNGFTFIDTDSGEKITYHYSHYPYKNDQKYLIAVNSMGEIKYISGNFFLSDISSYYKLVSNKSVINFASLKLYNYEVEKYLRVNKRFLGKWIVSCYSKNNGMIKMKISPKDPDCFVVKKKGSGIVLRLCW